MEGFPKWNLIVIIRIQMGKWKVNSDVLLSVVQDHPAHCGTGGPLLSTSAASV